MPNFGIFRVSKIKSLAELSGRFSHNSRTQPTPNADLSRRNQNLRPDLSGDVCARWHTVFSSNGSPAFRKDAVRALEILLTYSPEAAGSVNAQQWATSSLGFCEATFGKENVLDAVLHLDEKTPHVHVLVAPFHQRRLRASFWVDGPKKMRELQDRFFDQVARHFGLSRGERGSSRKHVPQQQLYASSNELKHAADVAVATVETLTISPPEIQWPEFSLRLASASGRADFLSEVRSQVNDQIREQVYREQMRFQRLLMPLVEISKHYQLRAEALSRTEIRLEISMKKEQAALAALREQSAQLRDLPLPTVAERYLGFPGVTEGVSLVWDCEQHKLVVTGTKFKDFKVDQGTLGGGAIDLGMHLLKCDYGRAIRWLAAEFGTAVHGAIRSRVFRIARHEATGAQRDAAPVPFSELLERFAARCESMIDRVRSYLSVDRCLPERLIDQLIDRGQIWSNKFGACVFAHHDRKGELRGCTVRGTRGNFKQCLGDKSNAWFSLGAPLVSPSLPVAVTESPIDAISYYSLRGGDDRTVISSGGTADFCGLIALQRPVVAAFDADEAGNRMAEELHAAAIAASISSTRQIPPEGLKDWNDFVCNTINKRKILYENIAIRGPRGRHVGGERTTHQGTYPNQVGVYRL